MRRSRCRTDDTRRHCLAAVEDFDMNSRRNHSKSQERLLHVCHEAVWPAEVNIGLSWKTDFIEHHLRQVTDGVKASAYFVARVGPAIGNVAAAVRERAHEAPSFGGEGMMCPVAGCL